MTVRTLESPFKVGIIGGGVAGATAALKMATLGIETCLFEANNSLLNGPPICHLHAGGNLYPTLPLEQCFSLLEQSIYTARAFPFALNERPTLIAVPQEDKNCPTRITERLSLLTEHYRTLIEKDPLNEVLGDPDIYFSVYTQEKLLELSQCPTPKSPKTPDEWMIPVAKSISLEKFKYPLFLVQEYGLSLFRLGAMASIALDETPYSRILLNHRVTGLKETKGGWWIESVDTKGASFVQQVDFLINAAGYLSGVLDDFASRPRKRCLEYKAAYLAAWDVHGFWPEVIVHGERGTARGMSQFSPYEKGLVQLHGMTKDITLFDGGLVRNEEQSAQPILPQSLESKINKKWTPSDISERTQKAIYHFSQWLPEFDGATLAGKPLCGVQQIPGDDPDLRSVEASFDGERYARIEVVKASSALQAIENILDYSKNKGWIDLPETWRTPEMPLILDLEKAAVIKKAKQMAKERDYPEALALPYPAKEAL